MVSNTCAIDTALIIGCGAVTTQRVRPALEQLLREGLLRRVAYLDILPACPFGAQAEYIQIDRDCVLPLDDLRDRQLLGPQVLALVCTPSRYHILYAKQLLGTDCRIAVEKPLGGSAVAARSLRPFVDSVFAIGHQLFKGEMLAFLERCREGGAL